jgi:lysine 2,3-aminomutase
MLTMEELDKIAINVRSHNLLREILRENPILEEILRNAKNETEALEGVRQWVMDVLYSRPEALKFYRREQTGHKVFRSLKWSDYAAIRLLDYIDNAGIEVEDLNLRGEKAISNPIWLLWLAVNHGTGGAKPAFFEDMRYLFRQFTGRKTITKPTRPQVEKWMEKFPSGLDPRVIRLREENRNRILNVIIDRIDRGEKKDPKYKFEPGMSREQKFKLALEWWQDSLFHLRFAIRSPELLNEMLGFSLDPDTMSILKDAQRDGIPFFINPYYLSLMYVRVPYYAIGGDLAIRDYVLYSRQLVEEFGQIVAWEKEDIVRPGEPNAAGWLLPSHNIHRRYPEVAILIPDTRGRACGGLCSVCQRMYGFQNGELNFDLDKLKPKKSWKVKLQELIAYFENDSQLRDILITGGDALMSSNRSLQEILDAVLQMAINKREQNRQRKEGEKYAELLRVRLGTKLPVYLPQRIGPDLIKILSDFKAKASEVGVKQFVIQTHFESPLEVTPESRRGIKALLEAGWVVTNQLVFTAAASRRGHAAKLRQVLNEIGVMPYYTFVVKGYMENSYNFANIARIVQEQVEEKTFGRIPESGLEAIRDIGLEAESAVEGISRLRENEDLPFLATDRSVLNLPGVGKSMTFRVIGITRYGRRILEFDHDATRVHSPIIERLGKVIIVESKSLADYVKQLEEMGEDPEEYDGLFGFSLGETEDRLPLYEYPTYDFGVTPQLTNIQIPN